MFEMEPWQWGMFGGILLASLLWMLGGILGVFGKSSGSAAIKRQGTSLESGAVGAHVPEDAVAFDGWSYRVGARFAGRVRLVLSDGCLSVTGPRVPRGIYRLWIWAQALLLAFVPAGLAAALVKLDWRWLALTATAAFLSWTISTLGAGLWPGLGELEVVDGGLFTAIEYPLDTITEVRVGAGWSLGGLGRVLWPYRKGIDQMAGKSAVSWFAPDEDGRRVRFAIHMQTEEAAEKLAQLFG